MSNVERYIIADTKEGAMKLEQMGFNFVIEQEVGKKIHYVFENTDRYLLFSDKEKNEYITTNNLYMCF